MPLADVPAATLRAARATWYQRLGHVPKLGQRLFDEAVDSGKRMLGLFTPPQDGKSYHIARHVGAYLMLPDVHGWIVAPTYEDGSKEFGYLFKDLATLGILRAARRKHYDIRGGNMHIELKNDSWVKVVSANEPENLRREQLDFVIYAEASKLPADLHERYVYSRVERRRGKVFWPTSHKGYGWVHESVRLRSLPTKDKTWTWGPWVDTAGGRTRERVGGELNPVYDQEYWSCQVSYVEEFGEVLHQGEFSPEAIAKARRRLPPPMFAEQFGGEAASYAGLIYPFDPAIHECEPFEIPRDWTHVVGYDHGAGGGSDPTAILFGSYSPDGTLYWWNEIFDTAVHSVTERAGHLKIKLGGRTPSAIMRGADAKQVGVELRQAGLFSQVPHDHDITARIIRMTELMQARPISDRPHPTMARRWKIHRGRCPNLKREILNYEWDEKNPGKPKDGNDHALEAAGYAALAPVSLPEASTAEVLPATPEARADKIRRDRVWEQWERERRDREDQEAGRGLSAVLESDPLAEEQLVVEAYSPW